MLERYVMDDYTREQKQRTARKLDRIRETLGQLVAMADDATGPLEYSSWRLGLARDARDLSVSLEKAAKELFETW